MNRLTTFAFILLLALGSAEALQAGQPVVDYETAIPGSWYEDHFSLDILIFKLDPAGNLLWTLPIVADAHDQGEDIAIDSQGFVWITGWTDSETSPIVNGMDDTLTVRDAFLMKLARTTARSSTAPSLAAITPRRVTASSSTRRGRSSSSAPVPPGKILLLEYIELNAVGMYQGTALARRDLR